jgi:hypothetical protein
MLFFSILNKYITSHTWFFYFTPPPPPLLRQKIWGVGIGKVVVPMSYVLSASALID